MTTCCLALKLGPYISGDYNTVGAVHREWGCDASLLPAVSHPDASCTELPRAEHNEGPRGSSVQDPSGRVRSELAAKALGAAACWRASLHSLVHPSLAHCLGAYPSHTSGALSHEDPPIFQRLYHPSFGPVELVPSETSREQPCSQNRRELKLQ